MCSGAISSCRLPTALTETTRSTPNCLNAWMLAWEFSSVGDMRWPVPCLGRNAAVTPPISPMVIGPLGSPYGVESVTSRTPSIAMSYNPVPPTIPTLARGSSLMPPPWSMSC